MATRSVWKEAPLGRTRALVEGVAGWRAATMVAWAGVLTLLLAALYAGIGYRLGVQWYVDPDYSHGFLIPLLSAYFVWERRGSLARLVPAPSLWGVALLGAGLLVLILGSIGAELYLQRMSFLIVLAGLVLLTLGKDFLWSLAFPIGFLVFMVPLPAIVMNAVAFPLQLFAAKVATLSLFSLGIPVLREGNIIVLAETTLEVAEACSGIRSLQALVALGVVYAYFTQSVRWKQVLLVLLSIPIAIIGNALRVSGTGVLAHSWGVEAAEGFYHSFSGLAIFGVAFMLLLACGALLSRFKTRGTESLPEGERT